MPCFSHSRTGLDFRSCFAQPQIVSAATIHLSWSSSAQGQGWRLVLTRKGLRDRDVVQLCHALAEVCKEGNDDGSEGHALSVTAIDLRCWKRTQSPSLAPRSLTAIGPPCNVVQSVWTCTLLCSYNKISAEGAVAVFEVVSCLGSVGELLMDGNRIGDAFACMNRATNLASLRILSLRANRIRVLDCMPFLPSLKTLLLDGNQIGDSFELNCLSNSCPSVERLSLSWCSIHNISRVCSALRGLTKLRVLALQQVSQVLFP